MFTFQVSASQFMCASFLIFGVGYTLLKYSRDGDNNNRVKASTVYADEKKTTLTEAWKQLRNLANYQLVEVTWNVFMFIAIVSTLAFLGLSGKLISEYSTNYVEKRVGIGAVSLLFAMIVFSLQDLVHKWRNAHRRPPLIKEMNDIMDRLQYVEK